MAGHPMLSNGDIARETGLSRQRVWQLAIADRIPAERANPGGKQHRFYDSAKFAAWRKEKARRSARPPAGQVRRAYRISRRRQEKIDKLLEILWNQTEVSASEKEVALSYFDCLFTLWWVSKKTQLRIPLLEGIHAYYESKLLFPNDHPKMTYIVLKSEIKTLPTHSRVTGFQKLRRRLNNLL